MNKITKFIIPGIIVILLIIIFREWFSAGVLSTGDWPYLYPQAVIEVVPLSAWDTLFNNGMGMSALPKMWFNSYSLTIVKLANVLSWPIFERVIWFFPYLLISFLGAYFLSKQFVSERNLNLISGIIYSLNTYILLIVSGGQVGVMMAYAFLPVVFYAFYQLHNEFSLKRSIIFSLSLAILIMLDLRVAYMFLVAEFFLGFLYLIFFRDKIFTKLFFMFVVPGLIALLLHFFWILPILIMGRNPASQIGEIYTSSASLDFFSFANMEYAIALLHPNWPENLFGKVSFLRPEFLIIPILAFASLLFAGRETKSIKISILSLFLMGLGGIFLAKGVNEPFGSIYYFLFDHFPGFVMFRDPTKWYMLIAVSFSILIPYSLFKISESLETLKEIKIGKLAVCIIFLLFWTFLIKDSFNGVVKGTLSPRMIPSNYQNFAKLIESEKVFSRTLWIPKYPTFAYVSNTHPAVPAVEFFSATSTASLLEVLKKPVSEKILRDASIKYVVVPEDIDKKIFVTDRKYDNSFYKKTLAGVGGIDYLSKKGNYGKIGVFEVRNPRDHFWSPNRDLKIQYEFLSPTKYSLNLENAKKGDTLVFAENFDEKWTLIGSDFQVQSEKYSNNLNSFTLPKEGKYSLKVFYTPQRWVDIGLYISLFSMATILIVLVYTTRAKPKKSL